MKAVLMSIKPEWCEKIASGKKTIEVRNNRPKLEVPFKVYIYETKAINHNKLIVDLDGDLPTVFAKGRGKVIGEFVCDRIKKVVIYTPDGIEMIDKVATLEACLTVSEISKYAHGKDVFAWYIKDLVVYNEPKGISNYMKPCSTPYECEKCKELIQNFGCGRTLLKPPQSWCYVEKMIDENL